MGTLYTTKIDSPIGRLTLATSEVGLAYVGLPRANGRGFAGWCARQAARDVIKPAYEPNRDACMQLDEFLNGKREVFDLPLDLRATEFQLDVYRVVAQIPYGSTLSYQEVAAAMGNPKAVRAVGAANGANPIPLVVPCHRVIAASGQLQGYAGGLDMKQSLLTMENAAAAPSEGRLF